MGENDAVTNKCKTPPEKVIPPNINFWTEKEGGAEIISQEG